MTLARLVGSMVLLAALVACAGQVTSALLPAAPAFLHRLWTGFVFPGAWLLSLVVPEVGLYAVPDEGGWDDFFVLTAVVCLGLAVRQSWLLYATRRVR